MIAHHYVIRFARRRWVAAAALLVVALMLWVVNQPAAEGRLTDAILPEVVELAAPAGFATASDDEEPAFREDEAGFSSYYHFADEQGNPVVLNVHDITASLLRMPGENNRVRAQTAGSFVDYGANFGIVTLTMVAAVGVNGPTQDVTVYYDNLGWIAAYLEPDAPESAIWRYEVTDDGTPEPAMSNNLLALAINEVINAHNEDLPEAERLARVSHNGDDNGDYKVKYYHWQKGDCDAFVMFSATASGGESEPIDFVVPYAIKNDDIHASATALITGQPADGADATAGVMVDELPQVMAGAAELRRAESFDLERVDAKTSLHSMSVSVDDGESAAGAVLLLYKRPS